MTEHRFPNSCVETIKNRAECPCILNEDNGDIENNKEQKENANCLSILENLPQCENFVGKTLKFYDLCQIKMDTPNEIATTVIETIKDFTSLTNNFACGHPQQHIGHFTCGSEKVGFRRHARSYCTTIDDVHGLFSQINNIHDALRECNSEQNCAAVLYPGDQEPQSFKMCRSIHYARVQLSSKFCTFVKELDHSYSFHDFQYCVSQNYKIFQTYEEAHSYCNDEKSCVSFSSENCSGYTNDDFNLTEEDLQSITLDDTHQSFSSNIHHGIYRTCHYPLNNNFMINKNSRLYEKINIHQDFQSDGEQSQTLISINYLIYVSAFLLCAAFTFIILIIYRRIYKSTVIGKWAMDYDEKHQKHCNSDDQIEIELSFDNHFTSEEMSTPAQVFVKIDVNSMNVTTENLQKQPQKHYSSRVQVSRNNTTTKLLPLPNSISNEKTPARRQIAGIPMLTNYSLSHFFNKIRGSKNNAAAKNYKVNEQGVEKQKRQPQTIFLPSDFRKQKRKLQQEQQCRVHCEKEFYAFSDDSCDFSRDTELNRRKIVRNLYQSETHSPIRVLIPKRANFDYVADLWREKETNRNMKEVCNVPNINGVDNNKPFWLQSVNFSSCPEDDDNVSMSSSSDDELSSSIIFEEEYISYAENILKDAKRMENRLTTSDLFFEEEEAEAKKSMPDSYTKRFPENKNVKHFRSEAYTKRFPENKEVERNDVLQNLDFAFDAQDRNFVSTEETHESCILCFNNINPDEDIYILNCCHFFHQKCAAKYLKNGDHCPVCEI